MGCGDTPTHITYRKFETNDAENEKIDAFKKRHLELHYNKYDTDSPQFSYIFSPCSFCCGIVIRCDKCKVEEDVLDYDSI